MLPLFVATRTGLQTDRDSADFDILSNEGASHNNGVLDRSRGGELRACGRNFAGARSSRLLLKIESRGGMKAMDGRMG